MNRRNVTEKAVILAAGRGTRMMAGALPPGLTSAQQAAARQGLKAMIPLGQPPVPFLGYLLSGLADAGFREVCLVVSPSQEEIGEFLRQAKPSRISVHLALQERPLGTAHAVLQAEQFAGAASFVVINGDNLYPSNALFELRQLPRAGLLGFHQSTLIGNGNIPPDRINAFALIEVRDGALVRIVEKPAPAEAARFGADPLVSMNAWLLPPSIFDASRGIVPSARGELELQSAVSYAIDRLGERFAVVPSNQGVLDLSNPADIPAVEKELASIEVRL
jgi:glucose-1-phosphate thymidylyltransferase